MVKRRDRPPPQRPARAARWLSREKGSRREPTPLRGLALRLDAYLRAVVRNMLWMWCGLEGPAATIEGARTRGSRAGANVSTGLVTLDQRTGVRCRRLAAE